jgi:RHS repeat-associated protein
MLRRLAPYLVTVAAVCGQLASTSPARAQHPNVDRGFSPSGMFDVGGLDVVNGFNGNLVITIPIGLKYPVGGLMGSYSFSLVYNSNVWSHVIVDEGGGIEATDAISDPVANAGLGWRFSLGRIGTDFGISGFQSPANNENEDYYDPEGGEHDLYAQPGDPATLYTRDHSFLRFLTAAQELDFPDGMRHSFSGDGYPLGILDQLGNGLNIAYVRFPAPNQDLYSEWDIQDTSGTPGRIHHVYFRLTGYTGNEQRAVVDHIDLESFGGGVATYTFLYNDETAPGVGTQTVQMTGAGTMDPAGWNPRVYLLTKLLLPADASGYRASYRMPIASYQAQQSNPVNHPGPINGMIFPTAGSATWSYAIQPLPQPNNGRRPPLNTIWSNALAVATRSLFDAGGNRIGDWNYTGTPVTGAPGNEVTRQLIYPPADPSSPPGTAGHRVVTYYSTCVHATCFGTGGAPDTYAVEYGLPFSRLQPGDGAGRFLSQQIFEQGAANPIRSIYVTFENDGNPSGTDEPIYANQRQQSERTFFLDDPLGTATSSACTSQPNACSSVATDSSDYDGLGHYRQETTSDTFGMGTPHIERTEWNQFLSGPPANNQPWILETYTFKQQQEGSDIERQEAVFDARGLLLCARRLKSGTTRSAHDVVVSYDHDNAGNVSVERWFGGDTGTVSTAASYCPGAGDAPAFTYNHLYASGTRSSTTVQLASGNALYLLNLAIDPSTGLTSVTNDPSGRPTSFTYDSVGRLLTVNPRGDATQAVTYQLSDTAPPRLTGTVGQTLEQETWFLDGLGRTVQGAVTLPGGAAATTTMSYNALGAKTFASEPASGAGTHFLGYDAFGRPSTVKSADGSLTYYGYAGVRTATRTQWVQQRNQQTDANGHQVWVTGEFPAISKETYDGLGRLRLVKDPNGTLTHYHYDVGGRLDAVLTTTGSGSQVRSFKYDGRAFLVREVTPEGGAVSYHYDARGHVTQRSTGAGTVFAAYDAAGRPTALSSPSSAGSMQLRKMEYDTSANGLGKLAVAHAYNWRSADSCAVPYEVRQDFSYDGNHGRLSQETTTLLHGGTLEEWTQSYGYDGAGRIVQTGYPSCLALCPAAPRSVTTNYSYGWPTSVQGFASAITYNPNGLVATINHQNNVVFTQTPDPTGMLRPSSLKAAIGSTSLWSAESYGYDNSGNVTQIGGKSFVYDAASRVLSATLPGAGALPYQEYTYDAFSNLTQVGSGTSFGNVSSYVSYSTDGATNHLLGAAYDGAGSLASFQGSTYLWDPLEQLTDVNTGSETWVHTYDATGERVWSWRTSPSRLDTYALRGPDSLVLSLFTKSASTYTWQDYVYRGGQLLGAQDSNGNVTHFDVDHLGSVRLISDANGGRVDYREYWPYGQPATPPASSERMSFTGHERDLGVLSSTADDMDYMHARFYRPLFGRFLSVDSLGGSPAEPNSWNRYAYTAGNPVGYVDRDGLGKIEFVAWLVERIPGGGLKLIHRIFNVKEAADYVKESSDVLAKSKSMGLKIAEEGSHGKEPILDPAHGGRPFRPHYHLFNREGGHIFYNVVAGMTLAHWAEGHGKIAEFLASVGDFFSPLAIPQSVKEVLEQWTPIGTDSGVQDYILDVTAHLPPGYRYVDDFQSYSCKSGEVVSLTDLLFSGTVCVEGVCAKQ